MAFCEECGNKVDEGSTFCKNCGAKVDGGAVSSSPAPTLKVTPSPIPSTTLKATQALTPTQTLKATPLPTPAQTLKATPSPASSAKPASAATSAKKMVELKEITKIYKGGGITPFSRLSLTVMSKELVVITGPKDCGKSTILRLIAGFEDLSHGEIRIDDDFMNKTPAADRYVSLVPQDYRDDEGGGLFGSKSKARLNRGALARDVKVYDNMAFDLQNKKVPKNVIDRRIDQTLKALDCEKFLDNYVKALNSAQCWRIAFGQAIVRNPKVYLFDDPFSGIEKNNQATLAEELLAIFRDFVWKDYNAYASIIFTAREPGEALTKIADRVIVMNKDGTIQK